MVPKPDSGRGYVSKIPLLLHCLLTIKQGRRPISGPFMRQREGRYIWQSTDISLINEDGKYVSTSSASQEVI